IRLASLFLTLPTRAFTGQQIIPSDGKGASRAFNADVSAGSSQVLRELAKPGFVGLAAFNNLAKTKVCRSHLSSQQMPKKWDESGFPDEGINFPDRPDLIPCKASKNFLFGCVRGNSLFSLLAIDSGLGSASEAAKKGIKSVSYGPIPYAS